VDLLQVTVAAGESGPVVRLSGESDVSTVGPLKDALTAQISGGARHLTVDLSELEFADSASINALLAAHRALRELGGGLELAFPQPPVAQVLTLLGVDRVLTVRTQACAGTAEEG
jgi:anti-sigma B factor antagonist